MATVTVDIQVNQDPVALDDHIVFNPNRGRVLIEPLANDRDPDGDPLGIVDFDQPDRGFVFLEGTVFVYETPVTEQFLLPQWFDYTITDGHGGTATATVFLNPDYERK